MPVPGGEIHMFAYSPKGGGGIRPTNPPEMPGSIPYIHVPSCADAYAKALQEGADEMMSPTRVMEGVTVAIVRAPGGVPIGFSVRSGFPKGAEDRVRAQVAARQQPR